MRVPARVTRRLLLAGTLISSAALGACYHRQYDNGYGEYGGYNGYDRYSPYGGRWSDGEQPYYRHWERETRREHRAWEERNRDEQHSYLAWRRAHCDRDDRDDRTYGQPRG